jgi:hypothetical protein
MNAFNRAFLSILALVWCGVLAGAAWLVWNQTRFVEIDGSNLALNFDLIMTGRAEQILASILIALLALPALGVLGFELRPRHERVGSMDANTHALEARVESLQRQLDDERRRMNAPTRTAAAAAHETSGRHWRFLPGRN